MLRLIVKTKNADEFKKVMKVAKDKNFYFENKNLKFDQLLRRAKKEISKNISVLCVVFEYPYIDVKTLNYCRDFFYTKVNNFEDGIKLLKDL